MVVYERQREGFCVSTNKTKLDVQIIHGFLSRSYWAAGVPLETVERSITHSLCFGVYAADAQIGFARVVTDYATFAYLADVFIVEEYRGKGLSKWLMTCIVEHPELQALRRWLLATRDAHGLYRTFGFKPLQEPDRFMERHNPDVYQK